MTKILVDFSQTVISACAAQANDLRNSGDTKNYIKHIALSMLLSWKKKFHGELIIICDSKNYWRKQEFIYYKGHRHHEKKDNNFIDWDVLFETLNELKEDLKANFPYKVIEVEEAEADDIISILVKYYQENELVNTGLIEEPDEIVIISTDSDFQQLQKYPNVRQWNNVMKKFIVCKNPKQYLIEHIVEGDKGDNVPSVVNGDAWAKARMDNVPTRAAPLKSSRMVDFYNKGIDACLNEDERRNWKRNEMLIDFDMIPTRINIKVIQAFIETKIEGSKAKVFNYLTKNRMKLLMSNATEF
jgi:hypothetical protein